MISKQEVEHIAKLARLELTEKEVKKMQKDLSDILDYFNVLKKASLGRGPKDGPTGEAKPVNKHLRSDEAESSQLSGRIIEAAPDKKDGYIKVKNIL